MTKRTLATLLWFYAGWYGGSVLATLFGVATVLGPLVGLAVALLVGGDPFHLVWNRSVARREASPASGPQAIQNPA